MKGIVPLMMTLEKLRQPHGPVPGNPLIAESLYLTKYIERMGTGVGDMIERCRNVGLLEPEFYLTDGFVTIIRRRPEQSLKAVTPKSALSRDQVVIMEKCVADATLLELMATSGRSDRTKFRQQVINPLLVDGLIEMTIPDKPRSSLQKYRLTEKGRAWFANGRS
jgi:ATP-dependent DNA helicase RecG